MIDTQAQTLSLSRQCELLHISRSTIYYTPTINEYELAIKSHIQKIYEEIPIYGYLKVHQQLLENGFIVSANTVHAYRKQMGLKAILALKAPNTSIKAKEHPIHTYKLKGVDIVRANQIWSTDITYIKIKGENRKEKANCFAFLGLEPKAICFSIATGVYLAAIIDWYSKAVLSWRISNTMDTDLVMSVLEDALRLYGKPEIFNTDQGSQYTSYIHTERLKSLGVAISMNGAGRSVDNICIERFWRSAKVEKIYLNEYEKVSILKEDVREYIEFYNNKRFHESINYKKPMEVYRESITGNNKKFDKSSHNQIEDVA